jgi:hypothetical protein
VQHEVRRVRGPALDARTVAVEAHGVDDLGVVASDALLDDERRLGRETREGWECARGAVERRDPRVGEELGHVCGAYR